MASKAGQRRHTWRSCSSCKRRKQRCELSSKALYKDPSQEPLGNDEACRRCHHLGIACVLDDFGKLARLAQERRKREKSSPRSSTPPVASASHFIPAARVEPPPPPPPLPTTSSATPAPSAMTGAPPIRTHPEDVSEWKRYSSRSRPVTLVSELVTRQMAGKRVACDWTVKDVSVVVPDGLSIEMSKWCASHLLFWLPFLPSPWELRQERQRRGTASPSSLLLEAGQYLVAVQYNTRYKDQMLTVAAESKLVGLVQRHLAQLILSPVPELRTSLALELVAVFPPLASSVEAIDPGLLAGMALRIATACKKAAKDSDDMRARLQWCSACVWETCYTYGNDDLLWRAYRLRDVPSPADVDDLLARLGPQPAGPSWTGQVAMLLRCQGYAAIVKALADISQIPCNAPETERLPQLRAILAGWEANARSMDARRCSLLSEAATLTLWLEMEACQHHLLVSAVALNHATQTPFEPEYLYNLILGIGVTPELQKFVFKHGDERMDAGETLLVTMTNMADNADTAFVFPALITCGYLLEAGMLTMDSHGTALKYWKAMPRRSESWILALRGALRLISRVQETFVAPACVKIVTGMLDAIAIWKTAALRLAAEPETSTTTSSTYSTADEGNAFLDELLRDIFGPSEWSTVLEGIQQQT